VNREATSRLAEALGLTLKASNFGTKIVDGDGRPIAIGRSNKCTLQQAQNHLIDLWTSECTATGVEPNLDQFK
jgi:hypothetical protein